MSSHLQASLRRILLQPTNGVVGIGDDLLRLADVSALHLEWHAESGRVRAIGDGEQILVDEPYRKSIFRAVLARVAAACNELGTAAVSPYGGHAELVIGADPPNTLQISFVNTPDAQTLDLRWSAYKMRSANGATRDTAESIEPAIG